MQIVRIREDIRHIFRTGFLHIFGSSVVNKIISFSSTIILVRLLSKNEYGCYVYVWNIYSLIVLFNGLGIENGVLQFASEKDNEVKYRNKVFSFGYTYGVIVDFVLSILILIIGGFAQFKLDNARNLIVITCLLPFFQFTYNFMLIKLRTKKANKEYARIATSNSALHICFSIIGAVVWKSIGVIVATYFAYFVSICMARFFDYEKIQRDMSLSTKERRELIHVSFMAMCSIALSQLLYLLDIFVLGIAYPDETILATYKIATIIPNALSFIPASLAVYLFPYFAQNIGNNEWLKVKYKKILCIFGTFNAIISLLLCIFAPIIISVFFGKQYLECVRIFRILSVNYFFSATFRTLSGNLLGTQRQYTFNLIVSCVTGTLNIILDWFFIGYWGAIGAAIATITVVITAGIISTLYFIKLIHSKNTIMA